MLDQNETGQIERYVSGTADKNDIVFVEELFTKGLENSDLRDHLKEDWDRDIQNTSSEADLDRILDHIHHMIQNKENQTRKSFIHRITQIYSKVAAILLLPMLITGGLIYSSNTSNIKAEQPVKTVIHAPLGSRVSFNLPDGTIGWLNSGSHLTYSLPFNNNRKIALEGEAWFDVAHNKNSPFEISTGNSKVKVLGTSFNVSAYPGSHYIEVVLQQGKVEFTSGSTSQKVMMEPSQKLVFYNNKTDLSTIDPSKYKAWTEGKLIFKGDNMTEVAGRIERWYNVKVILADRDLENFSFRGTFEDDSLAEVLHLLAMTSPIRYKIAPRILKSDGTYEKERVTLYMKTNKKIITTKTT